MQGHVPAQEETKAFSLVTCQGMGDRPQGVRGQGWDRETRHLGLLCLLGHTQSEPGGLAVVCEPLVSGTHPQDD